jgi:hypothetical protein
VAREIHNIVVNDASKVVTRGSKHRGKHDAKFLKPLIDHGQSLTLRFDAPSPPADHDERVNHGYRLVLSFRCVGFVVWHVVALGEINPVWAMSAMRIGACLVCAKRVGRGAYPVRW